MKTSAKRLAWLDWMRGVGALIMLQGHVFHSFIRNDLRQDGPYRLSQFVGGMPPALFLFVLGVTYSFLMDSQCRKGVPALSRVAASAKRSGYIFLVAFAFRLQLWLVSIDKSPWTDLLRVDILNIMGFSLLVLSPLAVFSTRERIRLCAIMGACIACAAPLVSAIDWGRTPWFLKYYFIPDALNFGLFPWAAFVAFGLSVGSLLRILSTDPTPEDMSQLMQWLGWGGLVIAFGAWTISNSTLTIYSNAEFWLNSPGLIFIKLGVILILMAFSWAWNLGVDPAKWSLVRQFGTTSLLVYWVHVELVYGKTFWYLKESLGVGPTLAMAVFVILLMLAISLLSTNWAAVHAWWQRLSQPGLEKKVSAG